MATSMTKRSRTLKYLPGHELRFGIAAVSRDQVTGDVDGAVCLFCKHFGREQRAGKKRKSASTVKFFRDSFRPDQYTQHHQLQHPSQWKRYKACNEEDKRQFFPITTENTLTTDSKKTAEVVLIPSNEERGRCFDLKAAVVEIVAVLAVGFGPVASTVTTRDRQLYEYMTHHNYPEMTTTCPQWTPPPGTFEKLYLVQKQPPVYRVLLFSRDQIDFLMELAAEGLSGAQIATSVKCLRHHAPMLLSDLVETSEKNAPTSKKNVAMAAERAEERAKQIFQVLDMNPEYNEAQTAEFVRLGVAVSLSIIARLLEESWVFSLELCTVAQHSMYAYLDVRVKFYNRCGGLRSAHLLAIPKYVGKCDIMMFQTLDRVLAALLPEWRKKLLGITTDGDIPISRRLVDVIKHFQNAVSGSALYRTSSCIGQLRRILNTFYASIDNGYFLKTLKKLSEYVRKEVVIVSDMKRFPGYCEQLDLDVYSSTSAPTAFGREVDMLVMHYALVEGTFKGIALTSVAPLVVSESWWIALQALQWITARANAVFDVLGGQYVTIAQQAAVVASLAQECITGFDAQMCENESTGPHSSDYLSLDKRVALSKANMAAFVTTSSVIARELVKDEGSATIAAVSDHFAPGAVNLIALLFELSDCLKQQYVACGSSTSSLVNQTTVVTDLMPPVMPHELAQLSSEEFDELLEAHDATSRGSLDDADVKAIYKEHDLLRRTFAEDAGLRSALEMCTQGTPFDVAWSLMDARFKRLEAIAGGLATVCPSNATALSDRNARDLVVCTKDMEEARLLFADFELESALHAQQFQSLTRLQEEMYDREISGRRTRKRYQASGIH